MGLDCCHLSHHYHAAAAAAAAVAVAGLPAAVAAACSVFAEMQPWQRSPQKKRQLGGPPGSPRVWPPPPPAVDADADADADDAAAAAAAAADGVAAAEAVANKKETWKGDRVESVSEEKNRADVEKNLRTRVGEGAQVSRQTLSQPAAIAQHRQDEQLHVNDGSNRARDFLCATGARVAIARPTWT